MNNLMNQWKGQPITVIIAEVICALTIAAIPFIVAFGYLAITGEYLNF